MKSRWVLTLRLQIFETAISFLVKSMNNEGHLEISEEKQLLSPLIINRDHISRWTRCSYSIVRNIPYVILEG
jgi:hypothetical protein